MPPHLCLVRGDGQRSLRLIATWNHSGGISKTRAASALIRPPTSIAATSRRSRELVNSSGYVDSFALRARARATPMRLYACGCGSPSVCNGDTMVASIARGTPWWMGRPAATISMFRPSCTSTATPASCSETFSRMRAPASRKILAQIFSMGRDRLLRSPLRGHDAGWSPK